MPRKDGGLNAQERYDKAHTKAYSLKLNLKTDSDLIEYIGTLDNFQGKVKELLRRDMGKEKRP